MYEIPETSRTAKGQAIVNFLSLQPEETVTAILDSTKRAENDISSAPEEVVKKRRKEAFQNVRKSGLIAHGIRDKDELGWVCMCSQEMKLPL